MFAIFQLNSTRNFAVAKAWTDTYKELFYLKMQTEWHYSLQKKN